MRTFEELELDPLLLQALSKQGFERPTAIQQETIPHALEGNDIIASAPTGTGKTLAFLIPVVQHMLDFPRKKRGSARILILTPTRELALQIFEQAEQLLALTQLKSACITGGISYDIDADILNSNQDLIIATPGRLMEYVDQERFDCRAIEWLILDEADRMLDMGFAHVVDKLSTECRWRKHTLLFSATIESHGVHGFTQELLTNPLRIDVNPSRRERKKIMQWYYRCDDVVHKFKLLESVLKNQAQRSIIFVKTKERLSELREKLHGAGFYIAWLQGDMAQSARTQATERFKEGKVNILLATDIAARGLDIDNVDMIINYDLPYTADIYLHRIGRTARAGKKGNAISLVEAHDQPLMDKINRYMQEEEIKERTISELKPTSKKPLFKKAKKTAVVKTTIKKKEKKRKDEVKRKWVAKRVAKKLITAPE